MEETLQSPPVAQPVNQPEPQHSNKMVLLILGAVIILIVGIGIGYVAAGNNKQEPSAILPTKTVGISSSPIPQAQTLETFKNDIFTFPYPASWGTASSSESAEGDFITIVAELKHATSVGFANNTQDGATITKAIDYEQTRYKTDLARINSIFASKRVDTNDYLLLPPSNAAITHYSDIQYIENKDASLRGIYYFARIAQNLDDPQLNTLVIILTDGKGNIIQFEPSYSYAKYPGVYDKDFGLCNHTMFDHNIKGTEKVNCQINSSFYNSYEESYKEIIKNISLT